jgi:hypothetical protein
MKRIDMEFGHNLDSLIVSHSLMIDVRFKSYKNGEQKMPNQLNAHLPYWPGAKEGMNERGKPTASYK